MATPNIVNVATINAKNAAGAITTSRAVAVDVADEKIAKINTILIANIDGTNAADVTIEVSIDDGSNYVAIVYFPLLLIIQKQLPWQLLFQLKP